MDGRKLGAIRGNVLLPLLYKWQRRAVFYLLKQAIDKTAPVLRRRDTRSLLESGSEHNCWQPEQQRISQARTRCHFYPELTFASEICPNENVEPTRNKISEFPKSLWN